MIQSIQVSDRCKWISRHYIMANLKDTNRFTTGSVEYISGFPMETYGCRNNVPEHKDIVLPEISYCLILRVDDPHSTLFVRNKYSSKTIKKILKRGMIIGFNSHNFHWVQQKGILVFSALAFDAPHSLGYITRLFREGFA